MSTSTQRQSQPESGPGTNISDLRRQIVEKARQSWIRKLIDLSRRNNLLYYRPLKTGTLDLSNAESEKMAEQAAGRWTGFQNFVGNLAGVVAPAITGLVLDRTGHFYWAFAILTAVALIGTTSWVFLVGPVEQAVWHK